MCDRRRRVDVHSDPFFSPFPFFGDRCTQNAFFAFFSLLGEAIVHEKMLSVHELLLYMPVEPYPP